DTRGAPSPKRTCPGDGPLGMSDLDTARRTEVVDDAALAGGAPCAADAAAVPDQQVRETRPVLARDEPHQVALDLDRVLLLREAEALRETPHMRVDDDPLRVTALGRDDVRRLACNAGQAKERVEVLRHLTAVVLDQHPHRAAQRLRLLTV